jgi:hypothetical protein
MVAEVGFGGSSTQPDERLEKIGPESPQQPGDDDEERKRDEMRKMMRYIEVAKLNLLLRVETKLAARRIQIRPAWIHGGTYTRILRGDSASFSLSTRVQLDYYRISFIIALSFE